MDSGRCFQSDCFLGKTSIPALALVFFDTIPWDNLLDRIWDSDATCNMVNEKLVQKIAGEVDAELGRVESGAFYIDYTLEIVKRYLDQEGGEESLRIGTIQELAVFFAGHFFQEWCAKRNG